jgi:hypothetical protein
MVSTVKFAALNSGHEHLLAGLLFLSLFLIALGCVVSLFATSVACDLCLVLVLALLVVLSLTIGCEGHFGFLIVLLFVGVEE